MIDHLTSGDPTGNPVNWNPADDNCEYLNMFKIKKSE